MGVGGITIVLNFKLFTYKIINLYSNYNLKLITKVNNYSIADKVLSDLYLPL